MPDDAGRSEESSSQSQPLISDEYSQLVHAVVCRPTCFSPGQAINPFQKTSFAQDPPRREVLEEQHERFRQVLASNGVAVSEIGPDARLPYQMFTRDACFCLGRSAYRANFRFGIRQAETDLLVRSTRGLDWRSLPKHAVIEGGDVLVAEPFVLVGIGERTDLSAIEVLRQQLDTDRWKVLTIELGKNTLHLDTVLGLLKGVAVVEPTGLAGHLPEEICTSYDIIELSASQSGRLATNFLAINDTTVVIAAGHDWLLSQLCKRGFNCISLEADEFLKLGGGFRCLTLPIRRERTNAS